MKRRTFIRVLGSAAGGAALGQSAAAAPSATDAAAAPAAAVAVADDLSHGMPWRVLGRTGRKVSVLGFPGLALIHYTQKEVDDGIKAAYDAGVNYYDVAPAYGQGVCETKMGIALRQIPRDKIFLACKTKKRDAQGCRQELETSLKLLKTDHFDLYQLHHLVRPEEDSRRALGPGGAMETILKAKEEGKIRHIGFSAHTTKAALTAIELFDFDTVMFPINFVEWYTRDMGKAVCEAASKKGAALLSIKAMSKGGWPAGAERTRKWWYRSVEEGDEVDLAWRWTLSLPGVAAGFPPSFLDLVEKGIAACKNFRPITPEETARVEKMAKECSSIFQREESSIAHRKHGHDAWAHCPCAGEADV